jgi:ATP-dependent Clp protease ATP-binding subunit ClpB
MSKKAVRVDPNKLSDAALLLEADLLLKVVGQDRAVKQLVSAYETFIAGLQAPRRPILNLFCLGPTGSGKTRLVEALAESLFGNADAMIKVDCAEFQEDHETAKLIGSPPGYVGFNEKYCRLTQEKLEKHLQGKPDAPKLSIVLFDEIEKASPAFHQMLLGILDKGILTLGNGSEVDFSKTIIVMTSNLGSANKAKLLSGGQLGFHTTSDHELEDLDQMIYKTSMNSVRKLFSAEFIGRIDRTIVFRPLSVESLRIILKIELNEVQDRLIAAGKVILVDVSERAREFLLAEGTNDREGARQLKKTIQRFLVSKLSSLIATKQVQAGDRVLVDKEDGDELSFYVQSGAFKPLPPVYEGTPAELS